MQRSVKLGAQHQQALLGIHFQMGISLYNGETQGPAMASSSIKRGPSPHLNAHSSRDRYNFPKDTSLSMGHLDHDL